MNCLEFFFFITDNIIYEAYKLTQYMDIKAIICPTETGYTARRLSTLKPNVPIIAFTKNDDTFKYLNLFIKVYYINRLLYSSIKCHLN